MSTISRRPAPRPAPVIPDRDEPRRFARRVKGWTIGFTVAGVGLAWALVSQNVVGATNAAPAAAPATGGGTSGRATAPSSDFFGQPPVQPQPVVGNPGGQSRGPVVRGGTS